MGKILYLHSKCHDSHWKLVYDTEVNQLLLVCNICNEPLNASVQFLPSKLIFFKIPCKCGCGSISFMSDCCGGFWELVYDRDEKVAWIECEECEEVAENVEIALDFTPYLCRTCERIN